MTRAPNSLIRVIGRRFKSEGREFSIGFTSASRLLFAESPLVIAGALQNQISKHPPGTHPGPQKIFGGPPASMRPSRHQAAHRDAAGEHVAKRHGGFDRFQTPAREFLLELTEIARKQDPRQRGIGSRQRPGRRNLPSRSLRLKWLMM